MPSGITGRDGFLPALVKSIRRSFPCRHPTTGGSLKGSPAGTPLTHRFLYYPYSTTAAAVCQPSFCPGPQPAGRRDGPSGEFARNVGLSNRLDGELVGRASAALRNRPENRMRGRNRIVSGPRGGCAPPCRCAAGYTGESAYAGCPAQQPSAETESASMCWLGRLWGRLDCQGHTAAEHCYCVLH